MILKPREAPYENSGELVTASCITDITFGCIPKISLLSECLTQSTQGMCCFHTAKKEKEARPAEEKFEVCSFVCSYSHSLEHALGTRMQVWSLTGLYPPTV